MVFAQKNTSEFPITFIKPDTTLMLYQNTLLLICHIPSADLPTVRELLSSGRLEQILSVDVREAILIYTQLVARARDLIGITADQGEDLVRQYPALIKVHYGPTPNIKDGVWLNPVCDTLAMGKDIAFLNGLGINAYQYKVYADRAVLPVSRELAVLHEPSTKL